MTRRFLIRRSARRDIQNARNWYDDQRIGVGDRFFKEIVRVFREINANPLSCPRVDPGVHRVALKKFPYSVLYFVDEDNVAVLMVVHHSRDPELSEARIAKELGRDQNESQS